jgi:hypothetical protein
VTGRRSWLAWVAVVALGACTVEGPPQAPRDSIAPTTSAFPPGGPYGDVQYVTLAGEEASRVYWSVDGVDPSPGAPNTSSAESPAFWIRVGSGTTTLKFFAVDRAGNREQLRIERYLVDPTPRAPWVAGTIPFREICPASGGPGKVALDHSGTTAPADLPFGFSLWSAPVRRYFIASSGFLSFDLNAQWPSGPMKLPSTQTPTGVIAPFWQQDMRVVCILEEPQAVTVEWTGGFFWDSGGPPAQFELVLHDDGFADFVYGPNHLATGETASIGADAPGGIAGVSISYDTANPGASWGKSFTLGLR